MPIVTVSNLHRKLDNLALDWEAISKLLSPFFLVDLSRHAFEE